MSDPDQTARASGARWLQTARGASIAAGFLALISLTGWSLGIDALKAPLPGSVAMNPLTALCLVVCATACWMLARARPSQGWTSAARWGAMLVAMAGAARVAGYATGTDIGVDGGLFGGEIRDPFTGGLSRMAPNTAGALALVATAVFLLSAGRLKWSAMSIIPAMLASLPCLLTFIGYANNVNGLIQVGPFIPMAVHTAIALTLLCVTIVSIARGRAHQPAAAHGRTDGVVASGFAGAMLVMSVIAIASVMSFEKFVAERKWRLQRSEVVTTLDNLASALKDAESGARGFMISGLEEYLAPYDAAIAAVPQIQQTLRAIMTSDADDKPQLDMMDKDIRARLESLATGIQIRRTGGLQAAQQFVLTGIGKRQMDELREGLKQIKDNEEREIVSQGNIADSDARVTVVIISAGSLLGVGLVGWAAWMVSRDVSRRQRVEAELREAKRSADAANAAKSEFLAHMSHEIRTPLNGVTGPAELLLGTGLTDQQRRYVQLVKTSSEALTSVINDILDFSKIEAGKLEIVEADFELAHAVEDVMQMLGSKAARKGVEIGCIVHPDVPAIVRGDVDRLRQIMINLVNNAIKFTQRGAVVLRVVLDGERDGQNVVRFTVTDTGIGIPRDRLDRLFKAFSQADVSVTRAYGGTGLGLAISKHLAELMGGSIGVESEAGRGSTFWFTVAFGPAQTLGAPVPRLRMDPRTLRVLAVHDSDVHRDVLAEQIKSWGLDAATAGNAHEAITKLSTAADKGQPFRVAIVDHDLPGTDAGDLAMTIRSKAQLRETVMMILVSMDQEISPSRLRQMGFSGHLTKPVRQSQLFDTIMGAIATARMDPVPEMPDQLTKAATGLDGVAWATGDPNADPLVLVAEDNEINQIVAGELLRSAGYRFELVSNGQAAVEAASSGRFDIILMDCQMPVMDGFEASRQIREAERARGDGSRVPIIALTANAMKGDRERCLEAGMDDYVSKPINPAQLIQAIATKLGDDRQMRKAA